MSWQSLSRGKVQAGTQRWAPGAGKGAPGVLGGLQPVAREHQPAQVLLTPAGLHLEGSQRGQELAQGATMGVQVGQVLVPVDAPAAPLPLPHPDRAQAALCRRRTQVRPSLGALPLWA